MKLHYYPETDSLYIELRPGPGVEAREISSGLVADLDAAGRVVGVDIDHASRKIDQGIAPGEHHAAQQRRTGSPSRVSPDHNTPPL